MLKIIVGDSPTHVRAMIKWKKLDPAECVVLSYGDAMPELTGEFNLIRPLAGPKDWHFEWIAGMMKPSEKALRDLATNWGVELKPKTKPLLMLAPPASKA